MSWWLFINFSGCSHFFRKCAGQFSEILARTVAERIAVEDSFFLFSQTLCRTEWVQKRTVRLMLSHLSLRTGLSTGQRGIIRTSGAACVCMCERGRESSVRRILHGPIINPFLLLSIVHRWITWAHTAVCVQTYCCRLSVCMCVCLLSNTDYYSLYYLQFLLFYTPLRSPLGSLGGEQIAVYEISSILFGMPFLAGGLMALGWTG